MQNWIFKQGFEYGKAKAKAEAEAEATANAVLKVLALRGLRVSKASRERILREADQDTLDRWLKRAITVKKAAAIFEEPAN